MSHFRKLFCVAVIAAVLLPGSVQCLAADDPLKKEFQRKHERWITFYEEEIRKENEAPSGVSADPRSKWPRRHWFKDNPIYDDLLEMGPNVLPYCFELYAEDRYMGGIIRKIGGIEFKAVTAKDTDGEWMRHFEEFPDIRAERDIYSKNMLALQRWWREREEKTPLWFAQRFEKYQEYKKKNVDPCYVRGAVSRISELGIGALPLIVKAIEDGHEDLIPALVRLANRAWVPEEKRLPENPTKAECVAWWAKNKDIYKIPPYRPQEEE